MHVLPRATACVAVIAAAGIVAACSSSGSVKSDNTGATTPATTPASTSAAPSTTQQATTSAASGQLSKAEFVAQANAVCGSVNAKVQKLPAPSGPTDYPATIAYTRTVLDLFPPFSKQTKALVARSADKDELTAKWISLDQSDFAAQKPLLTQLLAAAQAKQSAKVEQLYSALDKTPDHSQAEATYLNSYGLTECAKLQEG